MRSREELAVVCAVAALLPYAVRSESCSDACHRVAAGSGWIEGTSPFCNSNCDGGSGSCGSGHHCISNDDVKKMSDFGVLCATGKKVCCCEHNIGEDREGATGTVRLFTKQNCSGSLVSQYQLASVDFTEGRCVPIVGAVPATDEKRQSVPPLMTEETFRANCLQATEEDMVEMVNCSSMETELSTKWYFIGDNMKVVSADDKCLDSNSGLTIQPAKIKVCDGSIQQKWEWKGLDGGGYAIKQANKCLQANAGEAAKLVGCDSKIKAQKWFFDGSQWQAAGGFNITCNEDRSVKIKLHYKVGCTDEAFATADTPKDGGWKLMSNQCADAGSTSVDIKVHDAGDEGVKWPCKLAAETDEMATVNAGMRCFSCTPLLAAATVLLAVASTL
eukprot:TRINITY_DN4454_c0_g1_i1.p1 TRINITY_DN4454_c0_g1~~TRINITY_DN4454_c0_g1_i1.p1  ORF type:complete len:388 (+),score=86.42 TRINITY_DN4454_c0_g1_i1:63-1226(+)